VENYRLGGGVGHFSAFWKIPKMALIPFHIHIEFLYWNEGIKAKVLTE